MIENINLKNNVKVQKESIYLRQINELKDKLKLESEKNEKLSDEIKELKEKLQSLTEKVKQTENLENRFSKLAFNPIGTVKAVAENFKQGDLSQDDIDLYNALIGQ